MEFECIAEIFIFGGTVEIGIGYIQPLLKAVFRVENVGARSVQAIHEQWLFFGEKRSVEIIGLDDLVNLVRELYCKFFNAIQVIALSRRYSHSPIYISVF